jgi:flagellar hook-associated protein FlgK
MKPLIMEIKALLSDFLVAEDEKLRRKLLEDAQELLNEIRMGGDILQALKSEVDGHIDAADKRVKEILKKIDELEYGK